MGTALSRSGQPLGLTEIVDVRSTKAFDHTTLITMKVPVALAMTARFYKIEALASAK